MAERADLNHVKIRVEAKTRESEKMATVIVEVLEKLGYEVIEWSRPFPMRPPDETRARTYVGAIRKGEVSNG